MEEIQHCGQNRGTAVFSASCLEPTCPFQDLTHSFLRPFSFGSLPEEGNKAVCPNSEIRSQEAGRAWLLLRAYYEGGLSTQGGCSLILEAGLLLTQMDLFLGKAGLAAWACFFPHPLFRQLTSALLGRAIK